MVPQRSSISIKKELKMRQVIVSVMLLFLLSACAIGNKYDYRAATPELLAGSSGAVAVGVHDKRLYIVNNDKRPNFVGLQRGGFGNPFDVTTRSGNALADDFAQTIVDALAKNDVAASTVALSPQIGRMSALQAMALAGAERAIFVTLHEWKSDNFINVALRYDLLAEVLDNQGRVLAETQLQGRNALGAGVGVNLSTAVGDLVVEGYSQILSALLNDEKIVAALASAPSGSKVADAPAKSIESISSSTEPRLSSDKDKVDAASSQTTVATTAPSAQSTAPQASESEQQRIAQFIRNNENKVKARLASYNASKRIGKDSNSSNFKVTTIDNILVQNVDGDRATVELGFASGVRTFPSHHAYRYDLRLSASDVVILGHQEL